MKSRILWVVTSLLFMAGLLGIQPSNVIADPFANFAKKYRKEARQHEKKQEWVLAVHKWKIVRSFDPKDEFAYKKVIALRNALSRNKERSVRKGIGNYYTNKPWPAFKEFVKTLYWDPENELALKLLKQELVGSEFADYVVQEGDTIKKIAGKEYGLEKLGFVITYFNNLPSKMRTPPAGLELKIPVLSSVINVRSTRKSKGDNIESASAEVDVKAVLAEANEKLKLKQFDEVVELAQAVLEAEPKNTTAKSLLNQSALSLGKDLEKDGELYDAMNAYRKAAISYKGIKEAIASLDKKLRQEISKRYNRGVQFYTEEKFQDAIKEWEVVLELNPYHEQARKFISQAKGLLDKLKKVQ